MLVVEEAFDIQSPNFLHELRKIENPGLIKSFADRWKSDPRPWAREQILAFLEDPLSTPGHETLVKRLLRHAEECRDDELMAAFLVAFDRSVRRVRRIHSRFDPATSTVVNEESLMTPRGLVLRKRKSGIGRVPEWLVPYQTRRKEGALLFSYRTRYYLRRRVWRYFRKLGFSRPAEYPNAIARALVTYLDQDLTRGENILDSWGLMHALFRYSEALTFKASQIHLREGHGLGELVPFPRFPGIWRTPEAVPVLFSLVSTARARLIRVWAMRLLEAEHVEAFRGLDHEQILCFLEHDDDEVQQFGSRLLAASPLLAKLSVDGWLRLLETRSVTALNTVCSLMKRHVSTERFTVAQCVTIASARETPVASMGLEFLKARSITPPEAGFLTELADARCAALSGELTRWALDQLEELKAASGESLSRFFDSRSSKTRSQVMKWLVPGKTGYNDPILYRRLLETPYDEVRTWLVRGLETRIALARRTLERRPDGLPGSGSEDLARIWASVLLAVHRGSRPKATAIRQLGRAIIEDPGRADRLLPVLAVALRSVRASERRVGLSAVVGALKACPGLSRSIREHIPELVLPTGVENP